MFENIFSEESTSTGSFSDLDTALMKFSHDNGVTPWTIRDAVEGVQIFGGIGSGKTSGSGRQIALKYLSHGFGGLVLTVKPDEKDLWTEYCKETNRLDDLIIVEPMGKYRFNFLQYESDNSDSGNAITANIVQVLKTVIQASEEKTGNTGPDPFWVNATNMLMYNVIDLCKLAYGSVTPEQMYKVVQTLPKGKELNMEQIYEPLTFMHALEMAKNKMQKKWDQLKASLSDEQRSRWENDEAFKNNLVQEKLPEASLFRFLDDFFIVHYRNLSEKTRMTIEFSFSGFLFYLLKEPVNSLFCRQSNFTPDDSLKGKIILLNLPVKLYFNAGRDMQVMFKYIWQRAMERRDVKSNDRPVFLWADEAQNFLHPYDAEYQATARSSRIATVYLSQNLPNYYANMGGDKGEYRVKSFLGTLATKIFHANADIETNRYASDLIGDVYSEDTTRTTTQAGQFSASKTIQVKLERMVRPEKFNLLKTGGPANGGKVEAFIHLQSKQFSVDKNFMKISLNQKSP